MATIYIEEHVFNGAQALTGLKLGVIYDGKQAEVLIQGLGPIAALEQEQAIRTEIAALGEAIIDAVRRPLGLVAGPSPRDEP
jgi:hypothetical protein